MLPERVRRFIETEALLQPGQRVVVGVSGGVDSMVLLEVLRRLGYRPVVAHVNYRLRGADSDADEALVRRFCRRHRLPLRVARIDLKAHTGGRAIQATARRVRYTFFRRVARREGIDTVAVAHHRDDQAETLLLNLVRGSGLEGLLGMRPKRRLGRENIWLVRPLLPVSRAEIEVWAQAEGIPWREDVSNASLHYRRAVIRHEVLPLLVRHFGSGVAERLAHTAELLRAYYEATFLPDLRRRWQEVADGAVRALRLEALHAQPSVWQRRLILEALRRWLPGAPQHHRLVAQVVRLLQAQPGRRLELPQGTVWRDRDALRFRPRQWATWPDEGLLEPDRPLQLAGGTLVASVQETVPERLDEGTPLVAYVDADRIRWPLRVRRWQPGDRMQPLGMRGHRKVSDLLTDLKVPVDQRDRCYVVSQDSEIVWLVGYRLAEPFRVRPETRRVVKLCWKPDPPLPEKQ
ncbi:tRNA lysidine(34) synthetase TilS [Rhodothermus marinus]|uniref:tRNA lysidine(34) synthetase TilS n=1 Tax=Rhodothermus marinus TaxID=29549 RepID=UPI0012BA4AE5|nr:tRNA lysidine(34) synthetase TilS [Rhodothermus marinus]BBM69163.1 tRNA(Ile)-lysidine synthase [Rhodothermus marinus]BBM72155.1 tRNA(Ile)-lysidine synthase [Rhodothermus marinus]